MRHTLMLAAAALLLVGCHWDGNHSDMQSATTFRPDEIKWVDGPSGLPPGSKCALLEGDPAKPGFFTMRGKFPAGYRIAPHYHPQAERVTVLSGTLYMGHGDQFNDDAGTPLPAGSYTSMPAGMHHYAYTKGETEIQLSGLGPWGITYLDSRDDPRNVEK